MSYEVQGNQFMSVRNVRQILFKRKNYRGKSVLRHIKYLPFLVDKKIAFWGESFWDSIIDWWLPWLNTVKYWWREIIKENENMLSTPLFCLYLYITIFIELAVKFISISLSKLGAAYEYIWTYKLILYCLALTSSFYIFFVIHSLITKTFKFLIILLKSQVVIFLNIIFY